MDDGDRAALPWPGWSALTEDYWRAAGDGQLAVQRCSTCGNHRLPPSWSCYSCLSREYTWDRLPGTGTVYTYTWADQRPVMSWPIWNVSVIEVDGTEGEPVRLMTQVVDVGRDELVIGLRVEVCFEHVDDEVSVPMFRPSR